MGCGTNNVDRNTTLGQLYLITCASYHRYVYLKVCSTFFVCLEKVKESNSNDDIVPRDTLYLHWKRAAMIPRNHTWYFIVKIITLFNILRLLYF